MFFSLADGLLKRPPLNNEFYIWLQFMDIKDSLVFLNWRNQVYKNLSTFT